MSSPDSHADVPSPLMVQSSWSTSIDSASSTSETSNSFGLAIVIVPPTENMLVVDFVTSTFHVAAAVPPSFRSKPALLPPLTVLTTDHVLSCVQRGSAV